jgi:putative redox protein
MGERVTEVKVKWVEKGQFVGTDSTKHSLVMSAEDEENGTGLKPSDVLLLALGGCTGVDVVSILRKQRQNLTDLEINITAEQDSDPPRAFRKIHLEYVLHGTELLEHAIERAIRLSEDKYCSVRATICGVAKVTSGFRIVENSA